MRLDWEEKDILKMIIINELEYYEHKEDFDEIDKEYVDKLKTILFKIERKEK